MAKRKTIKKRSINKKKKALSSSGSSSSTSKAFKWIVQLALGALAVAQLWKGWGKNYSAIGFPSENKNKNNDEDHHNTQQQQQQKEVGRNDHETQQTATENEEIKQQQKEARLRRYQAVYKYKPPTEREHRNITNNNVNPICGPSPHFTTYFSQSRVGRDLHRSVHDEDRTIYKLFGEQFRALGSQGHYMELGAFDGLTESNTRFFDECLEWNGILIEGNPTKYDALVKNRPHAHRLSFAPTCSLEEELQNKTMSFHAVKYSNAGLVGFNKYYKAGFMVVDVACGRLSPVIEDIMASRIHFFSLDVTGSESLILKHIDFARVKIDMIMVANSNSEVQAILKAAGYLRYSNIIRKSDLYIHPQSEFRLPNERISG